LLQHIVPVGGGGAPHDVRKIVYFGYGVIPKVTVYIDGVEGKTGNNIRTEPNPKNVR